MHIPEGEESPVHDAILPTPISLRSLTISAFNEILQVDGTEDFVNRIKEGYQDDDAIKENFGSNSRYP